MKKIIIAVAALAAFVSCKSLKEEWQPVFDPADSKVNLYVPVTEEYLAKNKGLEEFTSIHDLLGLYKGSPVIIDGNVWIKGQVISSDETGNIYSEIYIQDATGGIDVKIGLSSTHNEYLRGQWLYVKCDGLTLGAYNGMPQLGMAADETPSNEYEVAYIGVPGLVEEHLFRGWKDTPVEPREVTWSEIAAADAEGFTGSLWGTLVTIKDAVYADEIFALVYPNPSLPHKKENPENRVFLSDDGTWGVDTWALSKARYIELVQSGLWDKAVVDSGGQLGAPVTKTPYDALMDTAYESRINAFGMDAFIPYKDVMVKYATANYVSHYFTVEGNKFSIRSSGFAKFADVKLDEQILAHKPVSITGILTRYTGSDEHAQLALTDDPSIAVLVQ